MKKFIALLLVTLFICAAASVCAEDLGIQRIDGNIIAEETLSLDNLKLGESYEIEGYAIVKPLEFFFVDSFPEYLAGKAGNYSEEGSAFTDSTKVWYRNNINNLPYYLTNAKWQDSGETAEFAILKMDLINLQKEDMDFMAQATVKVSYTDEYEFAGWVRQINLDYVTKAWRQDYKKEYIRSVTITPADEEEVKTLYAGTYLFGCTLPNEVVNSMSTLKITINLGENEMTYIIRK